QVGDDVVAGVAAALLAQLTEVVQQRGDVGGVLWVVPAVDLEDGAVGPHPELRPTLLRHAHELGYDEGGGGRGHGRDRVVDRPLLDRRQQVADDPPGLPLQRLYRPGAEGVGYQPSQFGVRGRVTADEVVGSLHVRTVAVPIAGIADQR